MNKFQENTQTQLFVDAILDIDTQASGEISEADFWRNLEQQSPFREALNARVLKLGCVGEPDDPNSKVKFITNQFKKHNIEPVISGATLKNWLTASAPDDSAKRRIEVYKLCFALEMNAPETAEFFFKAYLTRPFNYKDTSEAVYYWCLLKEKDYTEAERLISLIESADVEPQSDREMDTEELGKEIAYISSEEELVKYLSEHKYDKSEQHVAVTEKISELLKKCCDAANREVKCRYDLKDAASGAVVGNGTLLDVIFGYDESKMGKETVAKSSKFPKALKENWPRRQTFENIEKHNIGTEDAYRKALILLTFYDFYADAYVAQYRKKGEGDIDLRSLADEFLTELDETLAACGYIQIYPRNPFDGLIYLCTSYPDPLSRFRDIIDEFYLDNTGSTEE